MSLKQILEAVVRQLLERHPATFSIVANTYSRHLNEHTQPTEEELRCLLRAILDTFKVKYLVLDGLDEATKDIQYRLLEVLTSMGANCFITSRPMQRLQSRVPHAKFLNITADRDDIKLLVTHRLGRHPTISELLDGNLAFKEELTSTVQAKSGGM